MDNKIQNIDIDVIIPVYNGEQFILDAIHSVVNQTFPPKKIIVVNDGSTDNTKMVVSIYAEKSPIPIEITDKQNSGPSSARNMGIKRSHSGFVAFLDADDTWTVDKLEKQISVYKTTGFKNLGLVYCDYDVIDSNGIKQYTNYKTPLEKNMKGNVFIHLLERNNITSSASGVLIKRDAFDSIGLFDETLYFGEDWDVWLRIAERFEVDFVDEVLVHIRKNEHNTTANTAKIFGSEIDFYNKWISILDRHCDIPTFWPDKITFRIIVRWPKTDFLTILKNKLSKENYKKLFRKSFGSFYLYLPIFFVRQIFNLLLHPKNFRIILGIIKHKGR